MRIYNFKDNPYDLAFNYIIDEYKKEKRINNDSTIIYPGLDKDIISISNISKNNNLKLIVIARSNLDEKIKNIININGHELITIPSNLDIDELILMSEDIKNDIDNSVLINLFKEKKGASAYFKNSKSIYEDFKEDFLYLEIRFGIFNGIAKYFKMQNFDIKIIGVKTIPYDNELIDLDLFDEIIDDINKIDENALFIKI